jgi:hypothetical protein
MHGKLHQWMNKYTIEPTSKQQERIKLGCVRCFTCQFPISGYPVYCSVKCGMDRLGTRKVERPDKETLEKLLWEKPTTTLAKKFGVSDKAKGIANEVRDATQTYLYNVVVMNIDTSTTNASTIKDALIRDGSNSQKNEKGVYTGDYIVDIASIKQSYQVTYLYSKDDSKMGGNPIVVSCLPKDKLIYGEFNCKDIVSKQASPHAEILRYLPYQNFSFKLSPDATQNEKLTINKFIFR